MLFKGHPWGLSMHARALQIPSRKKLQEDLCSGKQNNRTWPLPLWMLQTRTAFEDGVFSSFDACLYIRTLLGLGIKT